MFYLWKNGESQEYKMIGGDLQNSDCRMLDNEHFDYVTAITHIPIVTSRIQGIYRYKGSEASLTSQYSGKDYYYMIKMRFTNLGEAIELYKLILAGKIRPEVSASDKQVLSPARHLRGLLREAWEIIRTNVSNKFHGTVASRA